LEGSARKRENPYVEKRVRHKVYQKYPSESPCGTLVRKKECTRGTSSGKTWYEVLGIVRTKGGKSKGGSQVTVQQTAQCPVQKKKDQNPKGFDARA